MYDTDDAGLGDSDDDDAIVGLVDGFPRSFLARNIINIPYNKY